eukprot:CAMPEP_0174846032 /NCGR_PEP_ID=MMETSP1114-20130205/12080_1 /TAXON_ID=312471 /ORGANISM="Neobodo designis, Strain CCAP 1951/1" /LENGTH=731 /DNA_ID=CAMNT_0016080291 /DNA_START=28 /DNA_END=2223 /DNA_ORIENTATION=+
MGIRLLLSWLKENFSDCFEHLTVPEISRNPDGSEVEHKYTGLYVDFNSILYQCVSQEQARRASMPLSNQPTAHGREAMVASFEANVLEAVVKAIDAVVLNVLRPTVRKSGELPNEHPRLNIFIGVDGVSPHGKTAQQRNRRALKSASRLVSLGGGVDWEMSAITPGTTLMRRVSATLEWYALSRVRQWSDVSIAISDSSVPGEGESKIFNAMRAHAARTSRETSEGSVCVCSNDTDVILGAALLVDHPHYRHSGIDVLRCDVSDPSSLKAPGAIFNVQRFRQELCHRFGWELWQLPLQEREVAGAKLALWGDPVDDGFTDAFRDVVFVFLLFGNDFVPKLPSMDIAAGSLDDILQFLADNFVSRRKHLVSPETFSINLASAQYLLSEVLAIAKRHRVLSVTKFSEEAKNPTKKNRSEGLSIILPQGADTRAWEMGDESIVNRTPQEREQAMCAAYWDGLQWTARYYCGACPGWQWAYPFDNAPSEEALSRVSSPMVIPPSPPPLPLTQMLMVLQGQSRKRLIPKPIAGALAAALEGKLTNDTSRNSVSIEAAAELSKPLHDQSIEKLDRLTHAFAEILSADDLQQLRSSTPYNVRWHVTTADVAPNAAVSTTLQPSALAAAATVVDAASTSFFGASEEGGLPGLGDDDNLDLFTHCAPETAEQAQPPLLGDDRPPVRTTLGGHPGDRIESLAVADATMRAAGAMPTITNSAVLGDGKKAKAIIEDESTWTA